MVWVNEMGIKAESGPVNANFYIGTCGWSYRPDWVEVFYPPKLAQGDYLQFYSQIFNTVEIDSSFYHIPHPATVNTWGIKTPAYFKFSAKLNREITHKAKLDENQIAAPLQRYFEAFQGLEHQQKMLAHLVQLPPSVTFQDHYPSLEALFSRWEEMRDREWSTLSERQKRDIERTQFWQAVVEFRNSSWMNEKTFSLLRQHQVGYCAVVEPLLPPRVDITNSSFLYLRFHGFGKKPWWDYLFTQDQLQEWALKLQKVRQMSPQVKIISYFNNHFSGNAVKNAMDLLPLLGIEPPANYAELYDSYQRGTTKVSPKQSLDQWLGNPKKRESP
jgi:uncharacterized protein YecE (DUF72 family)